MTTVNLEDAQLLSFFKFGHLPEGKLRNASKPFHDLAWLTVNTIDESPERTMALRKLLEAKDCAVRACLMPAKDHVADAVAE